MNKSGLLTASEAVIESYRAFLELVGSDPEGSQKALLVVNEAVNQLQIEVVKAQQMVSSLDGLKEKLAQLKQDNGKCSEEPSSSSLQNPLKGLNQIKDMLEQAQKAATNPKGK